MHAPLPSVGSRARAARGRRELPGRARAAVHRGAFASALALTLALGACGPRGAGHLAPLPPETRAAATRAASRWASPSLAESLRREQRHVQLQLRLRNPLAAADACAHALSRARGTLGAASLTGSPELTEAATAAQTLLDTVERPCVEHSVASPGRLLAPSLVRPGRPDRPMPAEHVAVASYSSRFAVPGGAPLSSRVREARLGDRPAAQAVSLAEARADRALVDVLDAGFREAEDLREREAWARALLDADPRHIPAALTVALASAVAAGELRMPDGAGFPPRQLLDELTLELGSELPPEGVARTEYAVSPRARAASPEPHHAAIRALHAWGLLRAGLPGGALSHSLRALEALPDGSPLRTPLETLAALAHLQALDLEGFRSRLSSRAVRASWFTRSWILRRGPGAGETRRRGSLDPMGSLRADAARAFIERGEVPSPLLPASWIGELAQRARDLPPDVASKAVAAALDLGMMYAPVWQRCLRDRLRPDACRRLGDDWELLSRSVDAEQLPAAWAALTRRRGSPLLTRTWVDLARRALNTRGLTTPAAVRALVDTWSATRVAAMPAYRRLVVELLVHEGDFAALRDALEREQALDAPEAVVLLEALAAAEAGELTRDGVLALYRASPLAWPTRLRPVQERGELTAAEASARLPNHALGLAMSGVRLANDTQLELAAAAFDRLTGVRWRTAAMGVFVEVYRAAVARGIGSVPGVGAGPELLAAAQARAGALSPAERAEPLVADALAALAPLLQGDRATASRLALQPWADTGGRLGFDVVTHLLTRSAAGAWTPEAAWDLLAGFGFYASGPIAQRLHAAMGGAATYTADQVATWVLADDAPAIAWAKRSKLAGAPEIAMAALRHGANQAALASSAATGRRIAAEALALARGIPYASRELRVALALYAEGGPAAAREATAALARAPAPTQDPLDPEAVLSLLSPARGDLTSAAAGAPGALDDDAAQAALRWALARADMAGEDLARLPTLASLLTRVKAPSTQVAQALCHLRVAEERADLAVAPCRRATEAPTMGPALAADLSYLAITRDDFVEAWGEPTDAILAAIAERTTAHPGRIFLWNHVDYLDGEGRHEDAAPIWRELARRSNLGSELPLPDSWVSAYASRGDAVLARMVQGEGGDTGSDRFRMGAVAGALTLDAVAARLSANGGAWAAMDDAQRESAMWFGRFADLADLAAQDVADGVFEPSVPRSIFETLFTDSEAFQAVLRSLTAFVAEQGKRSLFLDGMRILEGQLIGPAALAAAERIHATRPDGMLAGLLHLDLLEAAGRPAQAKALRERLVEASVRHPWARPTLGLRVDSPLRPAPPEPTPRAVAERPRRADEPALGPPAEVGGRADWTSADRFEALLRRVDLQAMATLRPVRVSDPKMALEGFMPAEAPRADSGFGWRVPSVGGRVAVVTEPRPGRVGIEPVFDNITRSILSSGVEELWRAETTHPLARGNAWHAVGRRDGGLLYWFVATAGGRTLALFAPVPDGAEAAMAVHLGLAWHGMARLDSVVRGDHADGLRDWYDADEMPWSLRLSARMALADPAALEAAPGRCPLADQLAALPGDSQRALLLLDAWLATEGAPRHRALTRCAGREDLVAAGVAPLAVLDDDHALYRWGRDGVARFPHVTRAVVDVLLRPEVPGVAAPLERDDGHVLPRFGILQIVEALPADSRGELIEQLLASSDPGHRALALTSGWMTPGAIPNPTLAELIRSAPLSVVGDALSSLPDDAPEALLDAVRVRLETVTPQTAHDRTYASSLANYLAAWVQPGDTALLEGLAERAAATWRTGKGEVTDPLELARAEEQLEDLERLARVHGEACQLPDGASEPGRDADADAWAAWSLSQAGARKREAAGQDAPAPVADALLASAPLSALVPRGLWSYAVVDKPRLLTTAAMALFDRLGGDEPAQAARVRLAVARMAQRSGVELWGEGSGLDLDRPVECAWHAWEHGFACSGYVTDAAKVWEQLTVRGFHDDSGFVAPRNLAWLAQDAPDTATSLPNYWAGVLRPAHDDDSATVVEERARVGRRVGGREVELWALVRLKRGPGSWRDQELYALVGDRLFVFGSEAYADAVLSDAPKEGDRLMDDERFAAFWEGRGEGALVSAWLGPHGDHLLPAQSGLTVGVDSGGIEVRAQASVGGTPGDVVDVRPAVARLPEGAALVVTSQQSDEVRVSTPESLGEGLGIGPLDWLMRGGRVAALGWYPEVGAGTWRGWVVAAQVDRALKRAARAAKLPWPRAGAPSPAVWGEGVVAALGEDGWLRVANTQGLLDSARAVDAEAAPRDGAIGGEGQVLVELRELSDANAAAVVVGRWRGGPAAPGWKASWAAFQSALIGSLAKVRSTEHWSAKSKRFEYAARIDLALSEGRVPLDVVDQLLASKGIRNALKLPRKLGREDHAGAMAYVLELDGAAAAAGRLPEHPRLAVEVLGPRRLKLTVAPGPSADGLASTEPLDDAARAATLASTDELPSNLPGIARLVRQVVPTGAGPLAAAQAVLAWVEAELTYDVTPEPIDVRTLLARRRGDCTEYSALVVTMLRAAGVPAVLREGALANGEDLVAHAWVAFHDGQGWHEAEPTAGRASVGSGHLPIPVAELLSWLSVADAAIVSVTPAPAAPAPTRSGEAP